LVSCTANGCRREARRIGDRMYTIGEPAPEPFLFTPGVGGYAAADTAR